MPPPAQQHSSDLLQRSKEQEVSLGMQRGWRLIRHRWKCTASGMTLKNGLFSSSNSQLLCIPQLYAKNMCDEAPTRPTWLMSAGLFAKKLLTNREMPRYQQRAIISVLLLGWQPREMRTCSTKMCAQISVLAKKDATEMSIV